MRHVIAVGVAALILTSPTQAAKAPDCFPASELDAILQSINEAASVEMTDGAGDMVRIYANVESGKWHLFVIPKARQDIACLAGAGENYTRYPSRIGRGA
jgi:hypothetical protein